MPRFEPFPGLRYDPDHVSLAEVVAPPYDVIAPGEQLVLREQSPYNSVRIELPDEEFGLDRYQAANQRLSDWQANGILRKDPIPSFYGYRMRYFDEAKNPRQTIGVIGALGLEPPGTAGIFPHERTTPKAKSDRLQLLQATRVNTSPIWGLSLAAGLSDALGVLEPPDGVIDVVTDADGIEHQLWPIADPTAIAWIADAVSGAPVVLADGHHRFETARNYQRQRHDEFADVEPASAPYDLVMALVVELVESQLSVQAIHRLISGLPGDFDLVGALGKHFDLTPAVSDATILEQMAQTDSLGLMTRDGAWLLRPSPATTAAAEQDLDASRLEVALNGLPGHEVVYQHGWDLASAAVGAGEAQAALLLRPVTVEQIASTGRGGERMPPKTTFFWPKPRTGFVFREVRG